MLTYTSFFDKDILIFFQFQYSWEFPVSRSLNIFLGDTKSIILKDMFY